MNVHARKAGQSLVEIIIALGIGAILIGFSTGILVLILKSNLQGGRTTSATELANQLLTDVSVVARNDWHAITNLTTGSSTVYYVTTSTPFAVATGTQVITLEGVAYTRSFYVDTVARDSGGSIVTSGGTTDPSTEKTTATVTWGNSESITTSAYMTRSRNEAFTQNNWSGGSGSEGPVTGPTSGYATSTNIDISTTGSIRVQEF